jgi:hypothetical protein
LVLTIVGTKEHFTFGAQPIWVETYLAGYMGQQMGPYFANGPTVGPLSVKSFDPFQGPISYGSIFVIGAKVFLGPFPLLRPKVLAPNLCHVDRHVGCEEIWIGPQYKALRPILTILSNPISRNLDNLGWHPFGPSM